MVLRLVNMHHHSKFGHKRLSDSEAIVRTEPEHTKGPAPLSDTGQRSDQLLKETSGTDLWNRVPFMFKGTLHWFPLATDWIIGLRWDGGYNYSLPA